MRPTLKIRFCDFHRHLPESLDFFRRLLGSRYELDESAPPDVVLYSNYGRTHLQYDCVRIFYSMENERPDYLECDFAITFDYSDDPRHLRLPYYLMQEGIEALAPRAALSEQESRHDLSQRDRFCAFVHSNPFGSVRNRLLNRLSRYKPIVCGGRYRNNLGRCVDDKGHFLRGFKFAFAFENDSSPGYTTEKLTDVFSAGAIPIYWGNPRVSEEFNNDAMLNRHTFASDEAFIQRIIEIDQDDALWLQLRQAPCFVGDRLPLPLAADHVLDQIERFMATSAQPVAQKYPRWYRHARKCSPPAITRRAHRFARHSIKGIRLATGW